MILTCGHCRRSYNRKPSAVKRHGSAYCSRRCMRFGYRRRMRGAKNPNWRGKVLSCCTCRRPFHPKHDKHRFYCRRKCYATAQRKDLMARGRRNWMGARTDANQPEIMAAARSIGASVFDTSKVANGFPDLVVAFRGLTHLVEVKNPKTHHGKAGLSKMQKDFSSTWEGGPVHVVYTGSQMIQLLIQLDRDTPPGPWRQSEGLAEQQAAAAATAAGESTATKGD